MVSTLFGNPNLVITNFETPPTNPLSMFSQWLAEAEKLGIHEPRSLVLSTVNQDQQPSSRVVFLRSLDDAGIIFATSKTSRKGKDLQGNPKVAGTLGWQETLQQINFRLYNPPFRRTVQRYLPNQNARSSAHFGDY